MKQYKYILCLLAGVSALFGCSDDELTGGDTGNTDAAFTVSVTDGGYEGLPTRAAENDYQTVFTAGDQIGVFAVKGGQVVTGVDNLCLTAEDDNGSLAWKDGGGNAPQIPVGATYYAYYPYQSTLTGNLDPAAIDAAGFFADVIDSWTPDTGQGTYAAYTAQDLMIAQGAVNGSSLSFSMQHQMSLVVIDLPRTKYTFDNTPSIPDYIIDATPDLTFMGFAPCRMSDGTYRYLVKPSTDPFLSGSYTNASSATMGWSFTASGITAGNYKAFKVDGGSNTTIDKTHTLATGDFYMKDGSLIGKDETLTAEQKAACIGIVLKAGKDDSGNWLDTDSYKQKDGTTDMTTIHGYVLALYDAGGGGDCTWGLYSCTLVGTNTAGYTLFCGYSNTRIIKNYATDNNKTLQTDFPAAYHATDGYESSYPAPAHSSGWFLPSAGQCWYWWNNRDVLQASMVKAKDSNSWSAWYWSSSEYSVNPPCSAWYVYGYYSSMRGDFKRYLNYVRSCLAF